MCLLHVPVCMCVMRVPVPTCASCTCVMHNCSIQHRPVFLQWPHLLLRPLSPMVSPAAETHEQTLQPFPPVVCQDQTKSGSHGHQQQQPQKGKMTHTRSAEGQAKLNVKRIKRQQEYFEKQLRRSSRCQEGAVWRGIQAANEDQNGRSRGGCVFGAAADDLCKRLKTEWDWHRDHKGEIWKKPRQNHACHLQADIIARYHSSRKNKIFMSLSEEQGNPVYPLCTCGSMARPILLILLLRCSTLDRLCDLM